MSGNVNDSVKESFGAVGSDVGQNVILVRGDTWREPVANLAALPSSGNATGDVRVTLDDNILHTWTGSAWTASTWAGTVTSVSVTTANGVSGSVATATSTPAITITLGAITPTSVNNVVLSGASTPTLAVTGTTVVSGTNTGDNATNSQYSGLATSKEDVANKSTSVTTDGTSNTKYPSVKSVKDYADSLVVGLLDYRGAYDASVNTFPASGGSGTAGAVLKGDMWILSVAGTLGGVASQIGDSVIANVDTPGQTAGNWNILNSNISYVPEDIANKVTSISGASTDTQYGSAKLLYDQLALKAPIASPTFTGTVALGTSPTMTTPVITGLPTGTGVASAATVSTLAARDASGNLTTVNFIEGYQTRNTAGGSENLTVTSPFTQYNNGSNTYTFALPVASTLVLGQQYYVVNKSTGTLIINSSGGNTIVTLASGTTALLTCILASGSTAASWDFRYDASIVATTKKLNVSNSLTFAGTDGTTMTFPTTSSTMARTDAANTFTGIQSMTSPDFTTSITTASTSFTALAGATTLLTIGGTGASASMFAPSTLDATSSITGAIRTSGGISAAKAANIGTTLTVGGAATAASFNKVAITAPATSATLTIADGKTLSSSVNTAVSGADVTIVGSGTATTTYPTVSSTLVGIVGTGRSVGATAAVASVATYTLPASDGSFLVNANVLVTTATTHSFTVTCAYTDEGNTARTQTLNFSTVAGVISNTAIGNAGGAVPYVGIPFHIRAKASTAITIATTGTFTTVVYNVEGTITKIA